MESCVLVIADDLAERAWIARALQSAGHSVELADAAVQINSRGPWRPYVVGCNSARASIHLTLPIATKSEYA